MDFSVINAELVTNLLLLMLIGMGPKIALVPFLEKTKTFDADRKRQTAVRMVKTATVAAIVLFLAGALLMKLLHLTGGAVSVGGGIVLILIALKMALGPGDEPVEEPSDLAIDHEKIAVYPLAVPYLLNPVGITVLILSSGAVDSFAASVLVVALILGVAALDYVVFTNIDALSKKMSPASLMISEVVFGILLVAVGVQLMVHGLGALGILEATVSGH